MKQEILQILDKHIDQQALAKDLALLLLVPKLEELKAKVESKEIDPLKFTELENIAIAKFLGEEIAKIKGE